MYDLSRLTVMQANVTGSLIQKRVERLHFLKMHKTGRPHLFGIGTAGLVFPHLCMIIRKIKAKGLIAQEVQRPDPGVKGPWVGSKNCASSPTCAYYTPT